MCEVGVAADADAHCASDRNETAERKATPTDVGGAADLRSCCFLLLSASAHSLAFV